MEKLIKFYFNSSEYEKHSIEKKSIEDFKRKCTAKSIELKSKSLYYKRLNILVLTVMILTNIFGIVFSFFLCENTYYILLLNLLLIIYLFICKPSIKMETFSSIGFNMNVLAKTAKGNPTESEKYDILLFQLEEGISFNDLLSKTN